MTLPAHRRGGERGTLASSTSAVAAAVVVLAAAVYYLASGGMDPSPGQSAGASPMTSASLSPAPSTTLSSTATPSPTSTPTDTPTATPSPSVRRGQVQVAVFNASRVTGLAGRTATRLTKLGWAVHRVDNWAGSLPASTVFFAPGMKQAARLLADDLGLDRVRRATSAMPSRGLTLILTGELS